MAYKDASQAIRYNNEYNARAYDRINLTMPKGKKEIIQAAIKITGDKGVNTFINRLIDAELDRLRAGGGFDFDRQSGDDIG